MSNQLEINHEFVSYCRQGNLKKIKKMFKAPHKPDVSYERDYPLMIVSQKGHLDIAQYLLLSPELEKHANLTEGNQLALMQACQYGHLPLVQFYLTSPKLKIHADHRAESDTALLRASQHGQYDVVRYLTSSPELSTHCSMNSQNKEAFVQACFGNHKEVIHYFIFNLQISYSPKLEKKLIKDLEDKEIVENIKKLFEKRNFFRKIEKDMENNQEKSFSKIKI